MTRRPVRPGLRSSVTAVFALGALLLSVALSVGTYVSARQLLLPQLKYRFATCTLLTSGRSPLNSNSGSMVISSALIVV